MVKRQIRLWCICCKTQLPNVLCVYDTSHLHAIIRTHHFDFWHLVLVFQCINVENLTSNQIRHSVLSVVCVYNQKTQRSRALSSLLEIKLILCTVGFGLLSLSRGMKSAEVVLSKIIIQRGSNFVQSGWMLMRRGNKNKLFNEFSGLRNGNFEWGKAKVVHSHLNR